MTVKGFYLLGLNLGLNVRIRVQPELEYGITIMPSTLIHCPRLF